MRMVTCENLLSRFRILYRTLLNPSSIKIYNENSIRSYYRRINKKGVSRFDTADTLLICGKNKLSAMLFALGTQHTRIPTVSYEGCDHYALSF